MFKKHLLVLRTYICETRIRFCKKVLKFLTVKIWLRNKSFIKRLHEKAEEISSESRWKRGKQEIGRK